MFPLLETIRFEDGRFANVSYHLERMKRSLKECFNRTLAFDAERLLMEKQEKNKNRNGLFKFRLLYDERSFWTEFVPYSLPRIKILKPVEAEQVRYHCKFTDRNVLNDLAKQKGIADDVLIVQNGMVSDTSFANIIFFDGSSSWLTPKTALLKGTQRAFLLDKGLIKEADIPLSDALHFSKAQIINAMIRLEDAVEVKIIQ